MSSKNKYLVVAVSLWICFFVATAAQRTCGVDFDDVGSSALLADIVAEGRARRVIHHTAEQPAPGSVDAAQSPPSVAVSVIFDHLKLYKGQLANPGHRSIAVEHFAIRADAEPCVAPVPDLDRSHSYLIFLRQNATQLDHRVPANVSSEKSDDARARRRRYRLSAFPVRKTRRTIATVLQYTNCTPPCGMRLASTSRPTQRRN